MEIKGKNISCSISEIESIIFDTEGKDKPIFLLINDSTYDGGSERCAIFFIQTKKELLDYGCCEEDWIALNSLSIGDSYHSNWYAGVELMRIS